MSSPPGLWERYFLWMFLENYDIVPDKHCPLLKQKKRSWVQAEQVKLTPLLVFQTTALNESPVRLPILSSNAKESFYLASSSSSYLPLVVMTKSLMSPWINPQVQSSTSARLLWNNQTNFMYLSVWLTEFICFNWNSLSLETLHHLRSCTLWFATLD